MSNTDDHLSISSSLPQGATVATDYHAATETHFQVVKLNVGGDGSDTLMTDTNPLPVAYTSAANQTFVPVAGSTSGLTPVQVQITGGATVSITNVTLEGGTVSRIGEGVSADIRTIPSGITIGVATIGESDQVKVTGTVTVAASTNNIGDVDVLSVAIPSAVISGQQIAVATGYTLGTGGSNTLTSGVRVTNFGNANPVYLGPSGVSDANGYKLNPYDSLFVEVDKTDAIYIRCSSGATTSVGFLGT